VHRLGYLSPSDVECRSGIPRTRPAATIIGLAAVVSPLSLERALDDALVRGLVNCAQIERRLERAGSAGRPGTSALADLLRVRAGMLRWTQSEFERQLFALIDRAGLPRPIPQFEVRLPSGRRAFLDFAWPDVLVALEANSYRHHGGRLAWSKDNTRNNEVISLGWRVLPVTFEDLVTTPDQLVTLLTRARAA
jgi:very-short-patch-repair endonuclease